MILTLLNKIKKCLIKTFNYNNQLKSFITKENNMIKKDNLFRLIADLVEMLKEYVDNYDKIIQLLEYNGLTGEQAIEWYGLYGNGKE